MNKLALVASVDSPLAVSAAWDGQALASTKRSVVRFADVKYPLLACLAAVAFGTSSASNVSLVVGLLIVAAASKRYAVSVGSSWKYVTTPFFGIVAYVSIFLTPACYVSSEEYSLRC